MANHIQPPSQADTEILLDFIQKSDQPVMLDKAFLLQTLPALINHHMGKKPVTTDALAELIAMNRSTLYRILSGQRRPSRDTLVCIVLALGLDYKQAQELLKVARMAPLSPRDSRDFLILFAIMHGHSLGEADELLTGQGLRPLFDPDPA